MVRPCPKNGRRKITQNSIEVDAETKESTRKTEEKLDGRYEGDSKSKGKIHLTAVIQVTLSNFTYYFST